MSKLSHFKQELTESVQTALLLKPPFPFPCHWEMHFDLSQLWKTQVLFPEKNVVLQQKFITCATFTGKCSQALSAQVPTLFRFLPIPRHRKLFINEDEMQISRPPSLWRKYAILSKKCCTKFLPGLVLVFSSTASRDIRKSNTEFIEGKFFSSPLRKRQSTGISRPCNGPARKSGLDIGISWLVTDKPKPHYIKYHRRCSSRPLNSSGNRTVTTFWHFY